MNKTILAMLIGALLISGSLYITQPESDAISHFDNAENDEEELLENEEDEALNNDADEGGSGELAGLVDCLEEEGVVIYGSRTCPACAQLIDSFGGYDVLSSIYVECMDDGDRCNEEKLTGFVPEVQINGEVHEQGRSPANLAAAVGCEF